MGRLSHGRMLIESERTAIEDETPKGAFERRLVVPAPAMPSLVSSAVPQDEAETTKQAPSKPVVPAAKAETTKAVARPMPAQEEKASPDAIETIQAPSTTAAPAPAPAPKKKQGAGEEDKNKKKQKQKKPTAAAAAAAATPPQPTAATAAAKKKMLWW